MSDIRRSKSQNHTVDNNDLGHRRGTINLSLPAVVGLVLGLLFTYFIVEIALREQSHPLHWVAASGGAIWGYLFGVFVELVKRTT